MFTGNSKQCLEFPVLQAAKSSRRMKEAWRKSIICNKPLQAALHAGIVFTPPLPMEIADRFCEYFTNIGPNSSSSIDISSRCFNSYLTGNMVNSLYFNLVTDIQIKEIINNLLSVISPGYDKIPMWLVNLLLGP